jgi:hypothetical protein
MKSYISLLINILPLLLLDSCLTLLALVLLYLLRLIARILGIKLSRLRSITGALSISNRRLII